MFGTVFEIVFYVIVSIFLLYLVFAFVWGAGAFLLLALAKSFVRYLEREEKLAEQPSMKTAIKPAVESHHLHTIDLRRRAGDR